MRRSEVYGCEEVSRGFVVACGDGRSCLPILPASCMGISTHSSASKPLSACGMSASSCGQQNIGSL
jgi:hypothetical protein